MELGGMSGLEVTFGARGGTAGHFTGSGTTTAFPTAAAVERAVVDELNARIDDGESDVGGALPGASSHWAPHPTSSVASPLEGKRLQSEDFDSSR